MILRYSLYFCNNSNNAAILLPLMASKQRKAFIYGLFHECEIIPTRQSLINFDSTKPNQFCLEIILCRIHGAFDYLIYPYYPAYMG